MAEKRMYSKKITDSDPFIEMASSAQALYFHLNQGADDDGFNNQIQIAMLKAHASIDDLKVLLTKNFIMRFESGVVVIKHWWIHNTLRKDRYTPTNFQEELKLLGIKDNKSYTFSIEDGRLPNGCQTVVTDKNRLDKERLDKISIDDNAHARDDFDGEEFSDDLKFFLDKWHIEIDDYNCQLSELDFVKLDKAYSESKWLQENFTVMSKICKHYQKIILGSYKDKVKNNPTSSTKTENDRTYTNDYYDSLITKPKDLDKIDW